MRLHLIARFCLVLLLSAFAIQKAHAASGIFDGYAIFNSTYYDLVTATSNPDFQGANLGNFPVGGSFTLGGQVKTFKNGSDNICGGKIWYAIYPASGSPGTFTFINLPYDSGFGDVPSGGSIDQQWQAFPGTNITVPSAVGAYKIAVYVTASGSPSGGGCGLDPFHTQNNGGAYWVADFTVGILINSAGAGGFELGSTFAANGWTVVNSSNISASQWFLGGNQTNGSYTFNVTGSRGAYVSNNNGTNWRYNTSAASGSSHFYRDVTFPSGHTNINLSFRWNANGETTWDILYVYLCPTTLTPVANSPSSLSSTVSWSGTGTATLLGSFNLLSAGSGQTAALSIPASIAGNCAANSNMRLVFTWKNDSSGGSEPPAAVDDIQLTAAPPTIPTSGGTFTIDNTLPTSGTNFNNFTDAINAANSVMICGALTGPITFNVTAGQTFNENPPALTASGNSTANFIRFQKSGTGANPKITPSGSAATTDFGFCISGGDFITFDGIDIEAAAAVEYGYLVRNASATNGAQNNTIQNTTITLNSRGGSNTSYGILQTASTTGGGVAPSSAAGANSSNAYYNLTISGVRNIGIYLLGNTSNPDLNCRIGTTACATRNSISNVGPTVSTSIGADGIRTEGQNGVWIFNNNISAVAGNQADSQGIYVLTALGNSEVYRNNISNISVFGSTTTTSSAYGIRAANNISSTNNIRIYNNAVANLFTSRTSATSTRYVFGIFVGVASATNAQSYDVDNNTVSIGQGLNIAISSACFEVQNGSAVYRIRGNIFANYTATQATGRHYAMRFTGATWGATGSVCNYNNYYIANDLGTSGFISLVNATTTGTLAAHQAALTSPASQDANSLTIDPQLINPNTDLHAVANGLNAVSGYTPQVWVVDDIECATRSDVSPHDLGAYVIYVCTTATGGTISPNTQSRCAGQTAEMTATGATTGAGITYQWEVSTTGGGVGFGDVSGGSGATTTSYTTGTLATGTYYYRLRVTCSAGPTIGYSNELLVTVNPIPTATASNNGPACLGGSVNLTGTTDIGSTYNWTGPNGFSSTLQNPTVSPIVAAGAGVYTFTATHNGCASAPATTTVSINPPFYTGNATANPATICPNGTSNLSVTAGTTAAYTVSSTPFGLLSGTGTTAVTGDEAVSASIPIPFAFNFFGTAYNNIFAYTNGWIELGTNSNSTSNYSVTIPTAAIPNTLIAGLKDDLNVTGGGTCTYFTVGSAPNRIFVVSWNNVKFWNGASNNGNATFQIHLFENDMHIEVHIAEATDPSPSAKTVGIENQTGTLGYAPTGRNNVTFSVPTGTPEAWAFRPSGGTLTYSWSPATDVVSPNSASTATNPLSTTTTFTVTVSDGACSTTRSVTVNINNPISAASITPASPAFCTGGSVTLTAVPADGVAPYTYQWEDPDGFLMGALATQNATTGGTWRVTVTDNCGGSVVATTNVTQNAVPTALASNNTPVCLGGNLNLSVNTDIGTTFNWAGPNGFSSNNQNPVISDVTLAATGTYTVTVTSGAGCTATAGTVVVVNQAPVISSVTATPANVCVGANSSLNVVAGQAVTTPTGGAITINSSGNASPYPSNIAVSGVSGLVTNLKVTITNLSHTWPNDIDMVLFGPTGAHSIIFTDAIGGSGGITGRTYTFQTGATALPLTGLPVSGTYGVVNGGSYGGTGTPSAVTNTGLGIFNGTNPNGTWSLYVFDDVSGDIGSIGSWSLEITVPATTYAWSPATYLDNTAIANPTASGIMTNTTYTVTVSGSAGCTATGSVAVTVNNPPAPTGLACWQTATLNTSTCAWEVSGTQPMQPTLACWQTATFNNTTCEWDVTGTQPMQPTLACWQTATFNLTTCEWEVSGTQPMQPTLACWQTATFNHTTCE